MEEYLHRQNATATNYLLLVYMPLVFFPRVKFTFVHAVWLFFYSALFIHRKIDLHKKKKRITVINKEAKEMKYIEILQHQQESKKKNKKTIFFSLLVSLSDLPTNISRSKHSTLRLAMLLQI